MTEDAGAAGRGIALLNLGRAAEAEVHFRRALAADPADADLMTYLAQALHRQERYAEARDVSQQAVATNPAHLPGLLVLSAALAGLKEFDAALDAVRRGLQIAPGFAALHRQEGTLLIAQKRAAEAFAPLERARTMDPEDADTIATIGIALFEVRRFQEAEKAAADALRVDPENLEAHRLRGLLQLRRGGGKAAVETHRTALRLDPTDPHSREQLATAMKSRNRLYGLMLRYSHWLDGLPSGARWAMLLLPMFVSRLVRPFEDQVWAWCVIALIGAAVVLSWTLEPAMNAVLISSSYGRNLLPDATKRATYAFIAYVAAAITAFTVGVVTDEGSLVGLAVAFAIWSVSAGQTHLIDESRMKLAIGLQRAGAVLAVVAAGAAVLGGSFATPVLVTFGIWGIGMLYFTAFA